MFLFLANLVFLKVKGQWKVATVLVLIVLKIKDPTMLQTIFKKKAKFSTLMLEIHE